MPVRVETEGAVLVVTLDRPRVMNSLDDATLDGLLDAWERALAPDVGAVVLTATGRAFCTGADLNVPLHTTEQIVTNQRRRYNQQVLAIRALPKPVVAAINGWVVGAGIGLACAADVRIASTAAVFKSGFAPVGATPDAGASWTLPRLVGPSRAFNLLCSTVEVHAEQALSWGLVDEVVAPDRLVERAGERSAELAAYPGAFAGFVKRLVVEAGSRSLAEHLEIEVEAQVSAARLIDRAGADERAQLRAPKRPTTAPAPAPAPE